MEKAKVIFYGVGTVGTNAVSMILDKEWIEIVGAIDINKDKVGKDLGDVAGVGRKLGVIVSEDSDAVLATPNANVVLHWTANHPDEMESQVIQSLEAGKNVITIALLHLSYPWIRWPELGQKVDEVAKKNGVTALFAGILPGLTMDLLPLIFSGACHDVRKLTSKRVMDIKDRSKVVVARHAPGCKPSEYQKLVEDGSVGYSVKTTISQIDMVADVLGWKLDEIRETLKPMISKKKKIPRPDMEIEPGMVCGTHYLFEGMKDGKPVVVNEWIVVADPEEEGIERGDYIYIEGEPNISVEMKGLRGEVTYASAVNRIPQVIEAMPGLVNVKDLPIAWFLE